MWLRLISPPAEEIFARKWKRPKTEDLIGASARQRKYPFELRKEENVIFLNSVKASLNLVSERVACEEVDEEVGGGVEHQQDVHHNDAVQEPEGQVVHPLLFARHLVLHVQSLVQACEHSETFSFSCIKERHCHAKACESTFMI